MTNKPVCQFHGMVPLMNKVCMNCEQFLETCQPIADVDGFALTAECCDYYFCEGCCSEQCNYKELTNF